MRAPGASARAGLFEWGLRGTSRSRLTHAAAGGSGHWCGTSCPMRGVLICYLGSHHHAPTYCMNQPGYDATHGPQVVSVTVCGAGSKHANTTPWIPFPPPPFFPRIQSGMLAWAIGRGARSAGPRCTVELSMRSSSSYSQLKRATIGIVVHGWSARHVHHSRQHGPLRPPAEGAQQHPACAAPAWRPAPAHVHRCNALAPICFILIASCHCTLRKPELQEAPLREARNPKAAPCTPALPVYS